MFFGMIRKFETSEFELSKVDCILSKISLFRPLEIKNTSLFKPIFAIPKENFPYDFLFDIRTTSLIRILLGSSKAQLPKIVSLFSPDRCHISLKSHLSTTSKYSPVQGDHIRNVAAGNDGLEVSHIEILLEDFLKKKTILAQFSCT